MTSSAKFAGIAAYNGNSVVSEYLNMIPLGDSTVDRLGESLIVAHPQTTPVNIRGCFVDSLGNIYTVIENKIHRYLYEDGAVTYKGVMSGRVNDNVMTEYSLLNGSGDVTFCETSTKPSQVMVCDGKYIYWWNTETPDGTTAGEARSAFDIQMLMSPGVALSESVSEWTPYDQRAQIEASGTLPYDLSAMAEVSSIAWFNNRLVAVQTSKNTVWLTCTDPAQFMRADNNPFDEQVSLWPDWYSSTNSSDRLRDAVSFAGQLFLLNTLSIEVWSASGNEASPLTPNTLATIYHGARSPLVMSDTLYLICRDQIGYEFIGAMSSNGQLARVSNPELEKRLAGKMTRLVPVTMRGMSFVAVETATDLYCYSSTGWWHLDDGGVPERFWRSVIDDVAVTNYGSMIRSTESNRTTFEGVQITRTIRDWFTLLERRQIVRKVEIVMDTGVKLDDDCSDRNIFCRVSTNRGLTFGPRVERKLGKPGCNDRVVVWRNMGSGNSVLIEFGTSAQYSLQIYDVSVEYS